MPDYRKVADALFTDRVGQPLNDWIADRRDRGDTWRAITRDLYDVTGGVIDVVPQTLINWSSESRKTDVKEPAA